MYDYASPGIDSNGEIVYTVIKPMRPLVQWETFTLKTTHQNWDHALYIISWSYFI